jgi:hypothetical protein
VVSLMLRAAGGAAHGRALGVADRGRHHRPRGAPPRFAQINEIMIASDWESRTFPLTIDAVLIMHGARVPAQVHCRRAASAALQVRTPWVHDKNRR